MKKIFFTILLLSNVIQAQNKETVNITATLDAWHKAASMANFNDYMNVFTDDAIYIGTDATENWNKTAFMAFAKPYFDKGKAWSFTALERHIYFDASGKMAWFDELLNTQMKICRGSGVLIKIGKDWKLKHYVLSMTIPNNNSDEVIKTKATIEDKLIKDLTSKKN
jgi:ketosteroid isomerase-like protein